MFVLKVPNQMQAENIFMDQLVQSQRKFHNSGRPARVGFRIEQLKLLNNLLKQNEKMLYEAINADMKKSAFETYTTELSQVYSELRLALKHIKKWAKPKKVKTNLVNLPARSYRVSSPLGVCLVISPWNYPYQLSLIPVISALAAGNTVILKPSEHSPHSSAALAGLINNNFDPVYFHVVEGAVEEATLLLEQKFDKIFFTGSTAVGKIVYQAAARHLTPVVLELGGKSPAIITASCNLPIAVTRLCWAKFLNAGQTCIAPDYVLVHASVKEEFLTRLEKELEKASYHVDNGNYVQIINDTNFDRLIHLMKDTHILYGGQADKVSRTISPTVITDVDFDDAIMEEEIFGPLLPVIEYREEDDVFNKIKSRPHPLACYLFTNSKTIRNKFLETVSFGGGAINDAVMQITNPNLPFGGIGYSGMGSYHGFDGFQTFSHIKSILDKPTWLEPRLKYYPYTKNKMAMIKLLMGLRR